jgi:hypothetical protein
VLFREIKIKKMTPILNGSKSKKKIGGEGLKLWVIMHKDSTKRDLGIISTV